MCGITGWISFDRDLRSESAVLDAMTATMACRGPDDSGTFFDGPAAWGTAGSPSSTCRAAVSR